MGRKRGNGEGSVCRVPGRNLWRVIVSAGYDATGRRIRRTFTSHPQTGDPFRAKRAALDAIPDIRRHVKRSPLTQRREVPTLAQAVEDWAQAAETDRERYNRRRLTVRFPTLLTRRVDRIRPYDVQVVVDHMDLHANTVRQAASYLRRVYNRLRRLGVVSVNPVEDVAVPRAAQTEARTLTPEQLGQVLAELHGHQYEVAYVLAATCGLRDGEIRALRWDDVDWSGQTLRVERAVGEHQTVREPKSESRRHVGLPQVAIEALRRRQAVALRLGIASCPWIVATVSGRLCQSSTLGRPLRAACKRLGLQCRFHDLRHTHATILLQAGVNPVLVARRLGHSTPTTTLDAYGHAIGDDRQLTDHVDRLLG